MKQRHAKHINIQPDAAKWRAIKKGMSFRQVVALIGRPLSANGIELVTGRPHYVTFGSLPTPLSDFPRRQPIYVFKIFFDELDRVLLKNDPFQGGHSKTGKPSAPKIILPLENALYPHYPRVLDLRWSPAAGTYPMRYEVEVSWDNSLDGAFESAFEPGETWIEKIDDTYAVMNWPGGNRGRFRVRGFNSKGIGAWSPYRYFKFLT